MQIDRRITNGLAWAGVLLVVGVPTADLLSAQFMGDKPGAPAAQIAVVDPRPVAPVPAVRSQRPAEKPVQVASVAPAKPVAKPEPVKPAAQTADVVDRFVQSGKPLPSYITDAPAAAPARTATVKPVPQAPAAPQATPQPQPAPAAAQIAAAPAPIGVPMPTEPASPTDPIQTAAIPPRVAPVPMPLAMRPRPVAVAAANPMDAPPVFGRAEPIVLPPSVQPAPPAQVTAQDLEDWETGPLADFLARRQAPQQAEAAPRFSEDDEVFFEREREFQRRDRLIAPEAFFYPFVD